MNSIPNWVGHHWWGRCTLFGPKPCVVAMMTPRKAAVVLFCLCVLSLGLSLINRNPFANDHATSFLTFKQTQTGQCHVDQVIVEDGHNIVVSILGFKSLAEVRYLTSRFPQPGALQVPELTPAILPCLANGTIILTDPQSVEEFLVIVRPHLKVSYVLITTDLDDSPPVERLLSSYLNDDPSFLGWFAANSLKGSSNKFHQIPLGLSQWSSQRLESFPQKSKTNCSSHEAMVSSPSLFLAFKIDVADRREASKFFCSRDRGFGAHLKCFDRDLDFVGKSTLEFYERIGCYDFGISPVGHGLDCYRTWELLCLGIVPIVRSSPLNELFDGLPVIIVDSWKDVSIEFLEANREHLNFAKREKLFMKYWSEKIRRLRPSEAQNIRYVYGAEDPTSGHT
eukprot:TRINITY_DN22506_c0_g1_i1.p1 TRINITY_DN22506_c0_g1~~TRINITY_DN22506_c0_g1_i1.p1  ORF type:complete len:395 (-),score=61.56 TRINITY_DN22506_c0_g1_i1:147-1331(-)